MTRTLPLISLPSWGFLSTNYSSLLHKAKVTTHLGSSRPIASMPGETAVPSVPLFEEPVFKAEEIPGPKLFRNVLSKQ